MIPSHFDNVRLEEPVDADNFFENPVQWLSTQKHTNAIHFKLPEAIKCQNIFQSFVTVTLILLH